MNRLMILAMGVVYANLSPAQSEVDALRYSQTTFGGTARYNAMSGAFGALGADFSTLSSNPAGIAIYRKSELTFTPSMFGQTTNSSYNGKTSSDGRFNFNFGNAGLVGTIDTRRNEDQEGWMSYNFGIGYNRMGNFYNRINMEGPNIGGSSLSDLYVRNANGLSTSDLDQFNEGLAFNTYVIDSVKGDNTQYFSYVPLAVLQRKSIETTGSMGETVVSFGGNYNNRFYIGGTVGFQRIRYSEESTYSESSVENDTISGFNSFTLNQQLTTRGTGVNIKLGMIYRITDWMRIGAAFHSPTAFSMHDEYINKMTTDFAATKNNSANTYDATSPSGTFDYTLVAPPRVIGSVGFIIAKRGLIGIDLEAVDYTYARLSSSGASFTDANDQVRKKYSSASNVRIGGEFKLYDPFTVRAGFARYASPYKNGVNTDASRISYSAGFGFREKSLFIDLAYVYTQYKEDYFFYDPTYTNVNAAHNNFSTSSFLMTVGVKF